jgi:hypothetical protein
MNVIVLNLPKRRDLVEQSWVNREIDRYNRRLGKHLKVFDRVQYTVINCDRKFHTSHCMHLNTDSKEYVARQLVSLIDMQSKKEELAVISLGWDNVKMNDEIVVKGKRTSENSGRFDEIQDVLTEEEAKFDGRMVSSTWGKRVRI